MDIVTQKNQKKQKVVSNTQYNKEENKKLINKYSNMQTGILW